MTRLALFVIAIVRLLAPGLASGLALGLVLAPRLAAADVARFAVLAGNNSGAADEADLRFAEADVDKMYDVLTDLGRFPAENMVVLRGRDAGAFRQALITVNYRIRAEVAAGRQVMLLVYYSGHADQTRLHLAGSEIGQRELEELVSGSAAQFRLLVVDACRSGTITRGKGGRAVAPFALDRGDRLAGQGAAFLAAATASEDAQESAELRGSFFTHYLVSGMLGAADSDRDGRVVLTEAYRFAYEHTLRASSRTLAGLQHPSFRYDLAGQGEVVLTWPAQATRDRAWVAVPAGRTYLVFRGGEDGPVVAEVGEADRQRTLSLKPGRYFVRARSRRYLLEGMVTLTAGQVTTVADDQLARIAYARLVRKGSRISDAAHAVDAGYRVRTAIHDGESLCHGVAAGYRVDFEHLGLVTRIGACRAGFDNAFLAATSDELDVGTRLIHAWDLPRVTAEVGVGAGASLLWQHFDTRGEAPDRISAAGYLGASAGLGLAPWRGLWLNIDLEGQTYFFTVEGDDGKSSVEARFAVRAALTAGKSF